VVIHPSSRLDAEDGPSQVMLHSGFEPGHIYELVYQVANPPIVGLGLAAVRDAIFFSHFESSDQDGTPNPLSLAGNDGTPRPDIERAYIYGSSQGGRFIAQMLWQGFHVDESDRMVFDGARIHAAGGGKGAFNHRFAQTSQHMCDLEGVYMPSDFPPFNYLPEDVPGSGGANDLLAEAKRLGKVPRIIITNNEFEYWSRSGSLIHTTLSGEQDVALHPNVRLYFFSGAGHRAAFERERGVCEHPLNRLNVHPSNRALMLVLSGSAMTWSRQTVVIRASKQVSLSPQSITRRCFHTFRTCTTRAAVSALRESTTVLTSGATAS
jgi:hypothetical protein